MNPLTGQVGVLRRLGEARGHGDNTEHPTAIAQKAAFLIQSGSGVNDLDPGWQIFRNPDEIPFPVGAGVSFGCQNDDDGMGRMKADFLRFQRTGGALPHQQDRIGVAEGHQDLAFRVAKTHIVLENLRLADFIDHQTDEERTPKIDPLLLEAGEGGGNDLMVDLFHDLRSDHLSRSIGAHPPGVRPRVAFPDPLVILAGRQAEVLVPGDHDHDRGFFALEKLLNDDFAAALAELVFLQHAARRRFGGFTVLTDDDPLAGGQTTGLNDHRKGTGLQPGESRRGLGESGIGGRWDPVFLEEGLAGRFAGFQNSPGFPWSISGDASVPQDIRHPQGQGHFRSDDDQVHFQSSGQFQRGLRILDLERMAGRFLGHPPVPRSRRHLCH